VRTKTTGEGFSKNHAILCLAVHAQKSCHPAILSRPFPLSEAQNPAILQSCSWLFMLILLVKTPTRALLSHSFFHTTLGGENTNKGYSEKSCHLAILSRPFPQSSIPSRKPAPSL
jgi:hypothetical protein